MLKRAAVSIITGWVFILTFSSLCFSQVIEAHAFISLLRDFDLNEATQNDYAITATEYEQLKIAWQCLSQPDKLELLAGEFWTGTFVSVLLFDLNSGKTWEAHINNMADYYHGVQNLALTLSRFNNPMPLRAARKTLVDLLHKGSPMFSDGRLRIAEEIKTQAQARAGNEARRRLEEWEQLINDYQNHSDMDKITAVNKFFNQQITQEADKETDYWQSPIETLVRGIGDCDDFAMAKYVSLRLLGIPVGQLRVAVVKGNFSYQHAVLFFFPLNEKDPWVLDNLTFEYLGSTDSHILRLSMRMRHHNLKPLWGINENYLTKFQEGLNETVTGFVPCHGCPKFGTALMNSQRLLPPTSSGALAFSY